MPKPHSFFGQRGDSHILELDGETYIDHDSYSYNLRARSNRYFPAGIGGEAIFPALYFTTIHNAAVSLFVTPIVDGVTLETQRLDLPNLGSNVASAHELGLSVPVIVSAVEVGRVYPRGTWLEVLVETRFDNDLYLASRVSVEGMECEYEIVRESRQASGVIV